MKILDIETKKQIGYHNAVNDHCVFEPYRSQPRTYFYKNGEDCIWSRVEETQSKD